MNDFEEEDTEFQDDPEYSSTQLRRYFLDIKELCIEHIWRLTVENPCPESDKKKMRDLFTELLYIKTLIDDAEEQ
jgi:hypothetical protein